VPANANLIKYIFQNEDVIKQAINAAQETDGESRICVFGAGPGTELLGLAKYFEVEVSEQQSANFLLIDKEGGWNISWEALRRHVDRRFRKVYGRKRDYPVVITSNSCTMDFMEEKRYGDINQVYDSHFVILCFVLSEIFDDPPPVKFKELISSMVKCAPKGGKFVFIDRGGFYSKFGLLCEKLVKSLGLRLIRKITTNTKKSTGLMDEDEDPKDMGDLYNELTEKGHSSKSSWDAFYVVGEKA
jgi:hypothetical protein